MLRLSCLLLLHLFACTSDGTPGSGTTGLAAYEGACDLSSVAAIDQTPGNVHVVVQDPDHLMSGSNDVTSIYKSILCGVGPTQPEVELAGSGGWGTITVAGVHEALRLDEVTDGGLTKLVYERRELSSHGLYVIRKVILKRTRSMTLFVSMLLPAGTDLQLDTTLEQLGSDNPSQYHPINYAYTFR